jgi:hypothetical protein
VRSALHVNTGFSRREADYCKAKRIMINYRDAQSDLEGWWFGKIQKFSNLHDGGFLRKARLAALV